MYVDSKAKMFMILYPSLENSTTRITITVRGREKQLFGVIVLQLSNKIESQSLLPRVELYYNSTI